VDAADSLTTFGAEFLGAVLVVGLIAGLFTWALLRAGDKPPQVALIISLSLLSLIALAIGATAGSETALTIAATGVGALAASVTATFTEGAKQYREMQQQGRHEEANDDGAA
jgi:hypothetical protein